MTPRPPNQRTVATVLMNLMTHLPYLPACLPPFLPSFLLVFPGILLQVNCLLSNPCFKISIGEWVTQIKTASGWGTLFS